MSSKVALIAAAIALSSPVFADNPPKPTPAIAKASASKSPPNKSSKTLTNLGGTANSGIISALQMPMLKNAKDNNADARKEAQAAGSSTPGGHKVPGNLIASPPKK